MTTRRSRGQASHGQLLLLGRGVWRIKMLPKRILDIGNDLRRQFFHMLSGILSPSTATSTISSVSFLDIPFTTLALHKGHCPNQPRSKHKAYLTDHTAPVLPWDLICKNHTLTTKALLSSPLVLDSSNSSVPPALPVPSPISFLSCNSMVHC